MGLGDKWDSVGSNSTRYVSVTPGTPWAQGRRLVAGTDI